MDDFEILAESKMSKLFRTPSGLLETLSNYASNYLPAYKDRDAAAFAFTNDVVDDVVAQTDGQVASMVIADFRNKVESRILALHDTYVEPAPKTDEDEQWHTYLGHVPEKAAFLRNICNVANELDASGFTSTASDVDEALMALAATPINEIAQALTIMTGIGAAAGRILVELNTLKSQNHISMPPAIFTKMQATQRGLSDSVSRLHQLLQTHTQATTLTR